MHQFTKNKVLSTFALLCNDHKSNSEHNESTDLEPVADHILERSEVIAQQDFLCGQIRFPTTIIYKDEFGKNKRVDSRISSLSLRPSCDMIRRCDDRKPSLCEYCDDEYANLLLGVKEDKLKTIVERNKRWDSFQGRRQDIDFVVPEVKETKGIYYFKYHCPMLGYIETMFPICFEGRVIAVLIFGQIRLSGEEQRIQEVKERFIEDKKTIFLKYIQEVLDHVTFPKLNEEDKKEYTLERIKEFIMCGDKPLSTHYIDIYEHTEDQQFQGKIIPALHNTVTTEEFNDIIMKICLWIRDFEKLLREKMSVKRSIRVKEFFEEEQLRLNQQINTEQINENDMKMLWNNVYKSINSLCPKCHLKSILLMSIEEQNKQKKLKKVAFTENAYLLYSDKIEQVQNMIARLLELPPIPYDSTAYVDGIHDDEHNKTLSELFSFFPTSEPYVFLFLPRRETPSASIFVIFEKGDEPYVETVMPSLLSGLKNYIILLSAQVAAILENSLQIKINSLFRFYRHETRNLANDFRRAIKTLQNISIGRNYDLNKLLNVANDADASLGLFWFLSENFDDIIVEEPTLQFSDFDVYDLIYKWESVRRHDLHDKNCEIVYEKRKVPVRSDSRYLEIIIYNLISNAVKYSYEGTKIYVDCRRDEMNLKRIVFSIYNSSFGIPENEREKIFENGYRCKIAKKYTPDGSGIGLWLCRRIASYFDGEVLLKEHIKISDYNVPFLKKMIENDKFHDIINTEELKKCQEAYNILNQKWIQFYGKDVNALDFVVSSPYAYADRNRRPEESYGLERKIIDSLHTPTYLVKFEVIIYEKNSRN